jgi:hypothetical protein
MQLHTKFSEQGMTEQWKDETGMTELWNKPGMTEQWKNEHGRR